MSRSPGAGLTPVLMAAALSLAAMPAALAQGTGANGTGPGWFVPKSGGSGSGAATHRAPAGQPFRSLPPAERADAAPPGEAGPQTPPVLPLPPIPPVPSMKKGDAPPAAIIGVLSVQDVMRASTAAQQVERVLGARRDKLNQEAEQEQAGWRATQQQIQDSRSSEEQKQKRERALQQRVLQAQRDFRNRNRILQEAAQVSLGQVERELVQVIREVAAARGMNLVLHREQVALNVNGFDITGEVTDQLNAALSSVFIPGPGVDPEELAKSGAFPTTANPGPQPAAPVIVSDASRTRPRPPRLRRRSPSSQKPSPGASMLEALMADPLVTSSAA